MEALWGRGLPTQPCRDEGCSPLMPCLGFPLLFLDTFNACRDPKKERPPTQLQLPRQARPLEASPPAAPRQGQPSPAETPGSPACSPAASPVMPQPASRAQCCSLLQGPLLKWWAPESPSPLGGAPLQLHSSPSPSVTPTVRVGVLPAPKGPIQCLQVELSKSG